MIIAIDGRPLPARERWAGASRLISAAPSRHGLIYRAVAKALLDAGHPLDDAARATAAAQALDPRTSTKRR
jgi:cytidylate kinase